MSTESTQSKACCNTPVATPDKYNPKGTYIQVDGLKTYATGSQTSKTGILFIYDIFGFYPQTIQGADILAAGYPATQHTHQVFMPDFFEGNPADISWYPPENQEQERKLSEWFKTQGVPGNAVERIPRIVKELSEKRGIEKWAVVGMCWGGKVVNLSSQKSSPFKVAAACHPAMVAAEDGAGTTIPYIMLPSRDESKEDVEKWDKAVKVPHKVEWFPDQIHGWMAARGDLSNEKVRKEYERGYKVVLDFFHEHL